MIIIKMRNKKKKREYKYDNGWVLTKFDKANDIINRKIFSKDNEKFEKHYYPRDDFARWIPEIDDIPSLIHSAHFFGSIKQTADTDLNKAVYEEAQMKMYLLVMKLGDIPGVIPAKQGDELGLYLDRVKQQYKPNYHRNIENLSDALHGIQFGLCHIISFLNIHPLFVISIAKREGI